MSAVAIKVRQCWIYNRVESIINSLEVKKAQTSCIRLHFNANPYRSNRQTEHDLLIHYKYVEKIWYLTRKSYELKWLSCGKNNQALHDIQKLKSSQKQNIFSKTSTANLQPILKSLSQSWFCQYPISICQIYHEVWFLSAVISS